MMDDEGVIQQVSEFSFQDSIMEVLFTRERTLHLIQLYKIYKPSVGTVEIKTMKKLWDIIARDLSNLYRVTISAAKCENKWKVLERTYKKVVDNNNKTGRDRKVFEFEKEFDEIFGKKCNIKPVILLSNDKVIELYSTSTGADESANYTVQENQAKKNIPVSGSNLKSVSPRKRSYRTETRTYSKRNEILLEMKNDLKLYFSEKARIDKEKLALQQRKLEDQIKRTALLEEYINTIKE